MSVIIPIPMFLPQYHGSRYADLGSASAIHERSREARQQHQELLAAINDGKSRVSVMVVASDITSFTSAAIERLSGPAADYERARERWYARRARIQKWQEKRRERKREKEREERAQKIEQLALEYQVKHSRWYRRMPIERARELAKASVIDPRGYLADPYYYSLGFGISPELRYSSFPKKPEGYDSLPAITELHEAACISPRATLTVPAETIRQVQRWAA